MNTYVADTHALYWYLAEPGRLGEAVGDAFDEAARGEATICIPAIVMAELYYLNEKLGGPLDMSETFDELSSSGQFHFASFEAEDVLDFDKDAIPEMHDRIIVGVARRLDAVCLTRDSQIAAAEVVPTVW